MRHRRWLALGIVALMCALQTACAETADTKKKEKAEGDKGPVKDVKVIEKKSGLKYQDLEVGKGAVAAKGKKVHVHYTGWLAKGGKKFDSSVGGDPLDFELGTRGIIAGWNDGVAGMKVGGKRRLLIPAKLGYAERGTRDGAIPPNADLVFDVELVKVE